MITYFSHFLNLFILMSLKFHLPEKCLFEGTGNEEDFLVLLVEKNKQCFV